MRFRHHLPVGYQRRQHLGSCSNMLFEWDWNGAGWMSLRKPVFSREVWDLEASVGFVPPVERGRENRAGWWPWAVSNIPLYANLECLTAWLLLDRRGLGSNHNLVLVGAVWTDSWGLSHKSCTIKIRFWPFCNKLRNQGSAVNKTKLNVNGLLVKLSVLFLFMGSLKLISDACYASHTALSCIGASAPSHWVEIVLMGYQASLRKTNKQTKTLLMRKEESLWSMSRQV